MSFVLSATAVQGGPPSPRAGIIADVFGVNRDASERVILDDVRVPSSGIVYITGFSGSGKSTLLRQLAAQTKAAVPADLPDEGTVIDMFEGDVSRAIHWLGKFGLGEARVMMTAPAQLSVGQKHRLQLAMLLWERPRAVIIDEFLSSLDRVTAQVVARSFQKICRELDISAHVATAHGDLVSALRPDTLIDLDLTGQATVTARPEGDGTLLDELEESAGTRADYEALAHYHYRDHDDRWIDWDDLVVEIRRVHFRGRPVAVKVFCHPVPTVLERLPIFAELNRRVLVQERVIVHPAFRGIGLNRRMMPSRCTAEVLFAQSALGRHFPYNLKACFTRIPHPSEEPTPAQIALQAQVEALGAANVHSAQALETLWQGLEDGDRRALRVATREVFAEVNTRHIAFLADLVGRALTKTEKGQLYALYTLCVENATTLAKVIEESMPFPMAGFVKPLDKETDHA